MRWYAEVVRDQDMMAAFGYSVFIAVASTAGALVLGLLLGLIHGLQHPRLRQTYAPAAASEGVG